MKMKTIIARRGSILGAWLALAHLATGCAGPRPRTARPREPRIGAALDLTQGDWVA